MGVKIYPRQVIERCLEANRELLNRIEDFKEEKKAWEMVLNEGKEQLQGRAWDNAREFIREDQAALWDVQVCWGEAFAAANNRYADAARELPRVNCLDKEQLQREQTRWNQRLDKENHRMHPREIVIFRCWEMLRELHSKLEAIAVFQSRTDGIYNDVERFQAVISRAHREMGKLSFDAVAGTINFTRIDRSWILECEEVAMEVLEREKGCNFSHKMQKSCH